MGAVLPNFAHPMDLSVARKAETASWYEGAQNAAWVRPERKLGNVNIIRNEWVRLSRDGVGRRIKDQKSVFSGRSKSQSRAPKVSVPAPLPPNTA